MFHWLFLVIFKDSLIELRAFITFIQPCIFSPPHKTVSFFIGWMFHTEFICLWKASHWLWDLLFSSVWVNGPLDFNIETFLRTFFHNFWRTQDLVQCSFYTTYFLNNSVELKNIALLRRTRNVYRLKMLIVNLWNNLTNGNFWYRLIYLIYVDTLKSVVEHKWKFITFPCLWMGTL